MASVLGDSWPTAVTLARDAQGFKPSLAAMGTRLLLGHTVEVAGGPDRFAGYRRSVDRGATWSPRAALSSASSAPSFGPVITCRGSRWHAAFERCVTDACEESRVYYRQSVFGTSSSVPSKVTRGPGAQQTPAGVTIDSGKLIVVFVDLSDGGGIDVLVRQGD